MSELGIADILTMLIWQRVVDWRFTVMLLAPVRIEPAHRVKASFTLWTFHI